MPCSFLLTQSQNLLDERGWERSLDGLQPYGPDLTEVTHFYYENTREPECADICASNANCIAASYVGGDCYIYDSAAESAPDGALGYVAGANEIVSMLPLKDTAGAITLSPDHSPDEAFMNTWLESTDSITVGPSSSDDWLARFSVYVGADEEGSYVAGCRQWCAGSEHCIAFFLYTNTGQCWIYDLKVTSTPVGASSYYSGARTLGQWVDYTPGSWVCFGTDKAAVPESVMFDFYLNIHINIRLL